MSPRIFPETLPAVDYDDGELVRKVQEQGVVTFKGRVFTMPKAFRGYHVALRPTLEDGVWSIWFMTHKIALVDLTGPNPVLESVNHVPEHLSTMCPVCTPSQEGGRGMVETQANLAIVQP